MNVRPSTWGTTRETVFNGDVQMVRPVGRPKSMKMVFNLQESKGR